MHESMLAGAGGMSAGWGLSGVRGAAELRGWALQEQWEAEFAKYRASPEYQKVNLSMGLEVRPAARRRTAALSPRITAPFKAPGSGLAGAGGPGALPRYRLPHG